MGHSILVGVLGAYSKTNETTRQIRSLIEKEHLERVSRADRECCKYNGNKYLE